MKGSKRLCFCIPTRKGKNKENGNGEAEKSPGQKPSNLKSGPRKKSVGNTSTPGDNNVGGNYNGATNTASTTDAGMAVSVVTAAHMSSVLDGSEGGGSSHGGDGG
ncbi:hypothetical protein O6P43_028178 [Quillaja saponaria]|uniref:Uncharacterized protein n=1 Tax=Quillaja saponaria TaxID=32244 RepID=A0AAD7KXF9_QUISA|nr:hypothetical protein O6P43_028178 [Quillaja saponaria]